MIYFIFQAMYLNDNFALGLSDMDPEFRPPPLTSRTPPTVRGGRYSDAEESGSLQWLRGEPYRAYYNYIV